MPTVRLVIEGDASSVKRAMGEIQGETRKTNAAISADARRAANDRKKIENEEIAQARRDLQGIARERARAAANRTKAEADAAKAREQAEARATKVAEAEGKKRVKLAADEAKEKKAKADEEADAREAAEKKATQASERESARRVRAAVKEGRERVAAARTESRERIDIARLTAEGIRAASTVVQAAHGAIQAPRAPMAEVERTLDATFANAGVQDPNIIADRRAQVQAYVTTGAGRGLEQLDVARVAQDVQQNFSSLSAVPRRGETSAQASERAMTTFLQSVTFARNTEQAIGPMARLSAALSTGNAALAPQDVETTMRTVTGIGRAGGLPADAMTNEALGSLQSRLGTALGALGPHATPEQRAAVIRQTTADVAGELSILKPLGGNIHNNALQIARTTGQLRGSDLQHRLLRRLRTRGTEGVAEAARIFTGAPGHEQLRPEFQNLMGLGEELTHYVGGDPAALRDLVGRGTARGDTATLFRLPVQDILAGLATPDASGRTGFARAKLIQSGAAITDENIAASARIVDNSDATRQTVARELGAARARAPSWYQRMSDRAQDWMSSHLLESAVGTAGLSTGARLLTGRFAARAAAKTIAERLAAGATEEAVAGTAGETAAAVAAGAGGMGAGLAGAIAVGTALAGAGLVGSARGRGLAGNQLSWWRRALGSSPGASLEGAIEVGELAIKHFGGRAQAPLVGAPTTSAGLPTAHAAGGPIQVSAPSPLHVEIVAVHPGVSFNTAQSPHDAEHATTVANSHHQAPHHHR